MVCGGMDQVAAQALARQIERTRSVVVSARERIARSREQIDASLKLLKAPPLCSLADEVGGSCAGDAAAAARRLAILHQAEIALEVRRAVWGYVTPGRAGRP
jgi:hypothetical protein